MNYIINKQTKILNIMFQRFFPGPFVKAHIHVCKMIMNTFEQSVFDKSVVDLALYGCRIFFRQSLSLKNPKFIIP